MRAAAGVSILIVTSIFIVTVAGCAARGPAAPTPAQRHLIDPDLPDSALICVPRETFRNVGLACVTAGELRALIKSWVRL